MAGRQYSIQAVEFDLFIRVVKKTVILVNSRDRTVSHDEREYMRWKLSTRNKDFSLRPVQRSLPESRKKDTPTFETRALAHATS